MEKNRKGLLTLLVVACTISSLVGSVVTYAVVSRTVSVYSIGVILTVNLGVYSDSTCTQNLTSLNWGNVAAGSSVAKTIYLKNTGSTSEVLSMSLTGWLPSGAQQYISVTWDRQNAILTAGESCAATLNLSVSQDITGITNFSVNIILTGTSS